VLIADIVDAASDNRLTVDHSGRLLLSGRVWANRESQPRANSYVQELELSPAVITLKCIQFRRGGSNGGEFDN
jgi:hypothetical protein